MKDTHKIDYYRFRNPYSIGPESTCKELALLVCYAPFLHRKVARFLNKLRRMHRFTFDNEQRKKAIKYARQAIKDTKLPPLVKYMVCNAVHKEFGFCPNDNSD